MAASVRNTAKFVELLAIGTSVSDASQEARIAERTAYRLLETEPIQREIRDFRKRLLNAASGTLAQSTQVAAQELAKLVTDEDPKIRLRAIAMVFDKYLKISEREAPEERLQVLEIKVFQHANPRTN